MTLLIRNVKVLGGLREYPDSSDVFIVGDKISAIGSFPQKKADVVFDGQGAYLMPGFIDIGATGDHYLDILENPEQQHYLAQGVTTAIGGHCGFSLAPLLYGRLDSLRKWGDVGRVNSNWRTVKEFLNVFKRKGLGINFGTMTGHVTVREDLIGNAPRELSVNELNIFKKVIRDSIHDGSFGLSFGLEYSHGKVASYREVKNLAVVASEEKALIGIHLRSHLADEVGSALDEALSLQAESKSNPNFLIYHLNPLKELSRRYGDLLALLDDAGKERNVYASIRPYAENIMPIYFLLPEWAQSGSIEEMYGRLQDEWFAERVKKGIRDVVPEKIKILKAIGNNLVEGKTLKEFMEMREIADPVEAIFRLMMITRLRVSIADNEFSEELLSKAMNNPRFIISTHAPKNSDSYESAFLKFLAKAEDEGIEYLEGALAKISSLPAKLLNLSDRGVIKEGNVADLVIYRNGKVKGVILAGNITYNDGEFFGSFGRPISRSFHGRG